MRRKSAVLPVLAFIAILGLASLACSPFAYPPPVTDDSAPSGVAAVKVATEEPTEEPAMEPTAVPTDTPEPTSTATEVPATATAVPPTATKVVKKVVPPTATPKPQWPAEIVVTEEEVEALAGDSPVEGLTLDGLQVRFNDGTMTLTVDNMRYGFIGVKNLKVVAQPYASNGQVGVEIVEMSPRSLVTAAIPGLLDQNLGQLTAEWYVEDLRVEPGELVLTVRPR
ncbi:MAG: hypothetical protein U9R25_01825 [Chloroflexota bacterium]|nr:hypothetical protein [Chloroflexota bacterium]